MTQSPKNPSRRKTPASQAWSAASRPRRSRRPLLSAVRDRTLSAATAPDVPSFEFDEITIAELQAGMTAGKYTARSIAEKYLARIDQIDKHGPAINSVIEVNPDALSIAEALDAERKDKGAARAAARHPGADQGQHRHCRPHDDHRGIARAGRLQAAERFHRCAETCATPAR